VQLYIDYLCHEWDYRPFFAVADYDQNKAYDKLKTNEEWILLILYRLTNNAERTIVNKRNTTTNYN
jgi:hypothetical protein